MLFNWMSKSFCVKWIICIQVWDQKPKWSDFDKTFIEMDEIGVISLWSVN